MSRFFFVEANILSLIGPPSYSQLHVSYMFNFPLDISFGQFGVAVIAGLWSFDGFVLITFTCH